MRQARLEAWKRLSGQIHWSGCLCWEEEGVDFDRQKSNLKELGYSVEEVNAERFAALEPHVAAQQRALLLAAEEAAEPHKVAEDLLQGVKKIVGVSVDAISEHSGRVAGISTPHGVLSRIGQYRRMACQPSERADRTGSLPPSCILV